MKRNANSVKRLGWGSMCLVGAVLMTSCAEEPDATSDGLYRIQESFRYGYIARDGSLVVPPKFVAASEFLGTFATVVIDDKVAILHSSGDIVLIAEGDEEIYFVDKNTFYVGSEDGEGSVVRLSADDGSQIDAPFDWPDDWTPTFARFSEDALPVYRGVGEASFLDRTGRLLFAQTFDQTRGFSEGLAPVKVEDKWGFINREGDVVISPQFDSALPFSNGLAAVHQQDRGWYFVDRDGEDAFDQSYFGVGSFRNGRAIVRGSGRSEFGAIDAAGRPVLPMTYRYVGRLEEGVMAFRSDEESGYMDKNGRIVLLVPGARVLQAFRNGLAWVETDEKQGYIETDGDWVWSTPTK